MLTQQELAALVQQQQQLQDVHNQPEEEAAEPEPQHSMPTGAHTHTRLRTHPPTLSQVC